MEKQQAPLGATTSSRPIPKKIVARNHLLQRSLIQPEANKLWGESCLHSTISELANRHGIAFDRKPESYGKYGALFTRYTLAPESREAAIDLLNHYIMEATA